MYLLRITPQKAFPPQPLPLAKDYLHQHNYKRLDTKFDAVIIIAAPCKLRLLDPGQNFAQLTLQVTVAPELHSEPLFNHSQRERMGERTLKDLEG